MKVTVLFAAETNDFAGILKGAKLLFEPCLLRLVFDAQPPEKFFRSKKFIGITS